MKDLETKIRQDAMDFLNTTDRMSYNDKIQMLTNLLQKYAILGKSDVMLNKKDLINIVSTSKLKFTELTMPVEMSDSEIPVHQNELGALCIIESTIAFLNKNDCLKRLPKFDYKKR